jgi:hypothetical protein
MEDENNVNLDTPNETVDETVETPATDTEEVSQTPEVDVDQLQASNKKLYERAKKAEADLKALRGSRPAEAKTVSPQLNLEKTILLANGTPEELIEELELRAPKYGGSLIKAQTDPKYITVKEKFEKDQKQEAASLGASRGSGAVKAKKDFSTPDLPREDHKKMVAEFR